MIPRSLSPVCTEESRFFQRGIGPAGLDHTMQHKGKSKRNKMKIPQALFMEWLQDVHKMDLDKFIRLLGEMYEARVYDGGYYVD